MKRGRKVNINGHRQIFERVMEKQDSSFTDSPFLCGYRKCFNAQYVLLSLLEKWRVSSDKKGNSGAILMELSKGVDMLNNDLLIAKLYAYGYNTKLLRRIKSYLSNRWQSTKVNCSFSKWLELLTGVPQGSVLGPLIFKLFINDLFNLFDRKTDVCNYADDNTLHTCDISLDVLMEIK